MATVMTSRQYSTGQPNLQVPMQQSNVTHVKMGRISDQSNNSLQNYGRNQALDKAPPALRRASEGAVMHPQDAVPPLPSRNATHGAPIRRQSFETHSFIDRNTAKAFSDPQRVKQSQISSSSTTTTREAAHSSAPGSQGSSATLPRKVHAHDDAPPPLPTSRPPARRPGISDASPSLPTANPPSRKQHPNQGIDAVASPPTLKSHSPSRKQQSLPEMGAPPSAPVASHPTSQRQTHQSERIPDPVSSPPTRTSHPPSQRHQSLPVSEVPPMLPPSRPPKTSHSSTSIDSQSAPAPSRPPKSRIHSVSSANEFEERYRFHEPNDFPLPDTSKISRNKTYPSLSDSVKRKSDFRERDDKLGPL